MTIRDMIDQFAIQGPYCIKTLVDDDIQTLVDGTDFECEFNQIDDIYFDMEITYIYVANNMLNIEIELE